MKQYQHERSRGFSPSAPRKRKQAILRRLFQRELKYRRFECQ